jgi:hypothetical protein
MIDDRDEKLKSGEAGREREREASALERQRNIKQTNRSF